MEILERTHHRTSRTSWEVSQRHIWFRQRPVCFSGPQCWNPLKNRVQMMCGFILGLHVSVTRCLHDPFVVRYKTCTHKLPEFITFKYCMWDCPQLGRVSMKMTTLHPRRAREKERARERARAKASHLAPLGVAAYNAWCLWWLRCLVSLILDNHRWLSNPL